MKAKVDGSIRWIHLRIGTADYEKLTKAYNQSTCRSFAEYCRKVLQGGTVTVIHRNQSVDDQLETMIELINEWHAAVGKLEELVSLLKTQPAESAVAARLAEYESCKKVLQEKAEETRLLMIQIHASWSQE